MDLDKVNFKDKVAIVTGASSGIGAAVAVALAGHGAKLTLVGRNEQRLSKTSEKCANVPLCLVLDLTQENSCEQVIEKTVELYKKIDVLVNCAGALQLSSILDENMHGFDEIMNINFRVPFFLSQLALPHLKKTKGNIVNMGSSMAKRHKPGLVPYIVTKTAMSLLSRHSALELQPYGVRINTVCPGTTRTNIFSNLNLTKEQQKEFFNTLESTMPQGKTIDINEVANFICMVASDVFPHLNGAELLIDGAASLT